MQRETGTSWGRGRLKSRAEPREEEKTEKGRDQAREIQSKGTTKRCPVKENSFLLVLERLR